MKKFFSFIVMILISVLMINSVLARTDEMIYTDQVLNTYTGRTDGTSIISNVDFRDINNHWAKESIIRNGALNIIKGYDKDFIPNRIVSNQEAIAYIIRAIGLEKEAQAAGLAIAQTLPEDSEIKTLWSLGYLNIALQRGMITPNQYDEALTQDQTLLDSNIHFVRDFMATRENIADYIVKGLQSVNISIFDTTSNVQAIYNFSDWEKINVDRITVVEAVAKNKIMNGKDNGTFSPKGRVTRAEMAQILKNMDSIYFSLAGIEKKTGTIGGIKDNQVSLTSQSELWRNIYVRTSAGKVEVLQHSSEKNSSPQAKTFDAVVYKDGRVRGLMALEENDQIEYLIDKNTKDILYVQVLSSEIKELKVQGKLYSFDYNTGEINITGENSKQFIFNLVEGLYGIDGTVKYVIMDDKRVEISKLPIGSKVELFLKNNIVNKITYIGDPVSIQETRGIVVENNAEFGYITMITNDGKELTKNYNSSDIKVEKQQHYDLDDEVGYLDEIFKSDVYDARDTDISDIEPGDIVFIRTFKDDQDTIESISASTNYMMQYGKIKDFKRFDKYFDVLIEFEDKQTSWFSVPNTIFISKNGKPINESDVQIGDYTKILVNQAIVTQGYVIEAVKEIIIEGSGHYITSIIKGQLAGINTIQNELLIQNSQKLNKAGWTEYNQVQNFSLKQKDIEYYVDNKKISLDYAIKYLKRADGVVYLALENNYAGEKIKKVTFRSSRDELLSGDTVTMSDGNGSFQIMSNNGMIQTDEGTIVRRNGRLVDGTNIMPSDYTVVSLNSEGKAAVVDINTAPDVSGIMIVRGRIKTVDDGKSFKVQSMATLTGNKWVYSPVQREFTIDYDTVFIKTYGESSVGIENINNFIDYTKSSVVDKVYNIVVDGSKATHIVLSNYAQTSVKGTIYENSGGAIGIKDVTCYDPNTGKWNTLSNINNTLTIIVQLNSIVAKTNKIVSQNNLEVGDTIKVMTDVLPAKVSSGSTIDGYIILTEK